MFSSRGQKNAKGFTLVEVIVVAVIVAVLALVGIQLYQGYATEARRNMAENLAASAASYLQTFVNSRGDTSDVSSTNFPKLVGKYPAQSKWNRPLSPLVEMTETTDSSCVSFTCPATAELEIQGDSVVAKVTDVPSRGSYKFK